MGMKDDMKDKMGGNIDAMKARFEELKSKEREGNLDDKAREELSQLRSHFEKK